MENPTKGTARTPASGPPPRGARTGRTAAAALGALALSYLVAHALVALPPVRAWARLRAEEALRSRAGVATVADVGVDGLFRVVAGPVALGGTAERPAVTVERIRVTPSALALLQGRLEAASLHVRGVRVDAGGIDALRDLVAPRRAGPGEGSPGPGSARSWPRVKARGLRVAWAPGVEVGPFDADVWPDAGGARAEVRLPAGGKVALHLRRAGVVTLGLRASGLRPAALGGLAELLPVSFPAGVASLELDARAPADLSRAEAQLRADVEGLVASGGHLDREPVGPIHVAARTRVAWERSGRRLADADRGSTGALAGTVRLTDGELSLGGALRATFDAELGIEDGLPLVASLRARGIPYAAFSASLPASLGPPEAAPRPAGVLGASLAVEGPLLSPGAWTFAAELDLSRMRAAAQRASPVDLRAPFTYRPEGAPPFQVGPDNPDFVPLDALPDHVARAVTTSEDAGFFAHSGFDFAEIGNAMAEGIEAGRVVRGGSTITQQLAKNLWLSRDRLLARKVREALGAIALEATVPKDRLLEIYLNVAEWGPGVYGIGPAARHWFGKDARELTPKEAALLAAVIPSPARYDAMRARGAPTEALEQRVAEILLHMSDRGVLAHDELLRALEEPIVFAGARAPATAPPSEGGGG